MTRARQIAFGFAVVLLAVASWVISGELLTPRVPGEIQITVGDSRVGGPFALTDQTGRAVTDQDLRGRPFILYFGWTHDPDLTPAALQVLGAALADVGRGGGAAPRVVFATLDPDRDAPSAVATFLAKHANGATGLTGSDAQIAALASAYKLYWKRIPESSLPAGYSIDHASQYYVMGEDGAFLGHIPHTTERAELAREIKRLLQN
jgi:protein SCO1/2